MQVVNKQTLIESVRRFCHGCAPDQDMAQCVDVDCPLYDYVERIMDGSDSSCFKIGALLKAIRIRCLQCVGESNVSVGICHSTKCSLWKWRFGSKRPAQKDESREVWDNLIGNNEPDKPDDDSDKTDDDPWKGILG